MQKKISLMKEYRADKGTCKEAKSSNTKPLEWKLLQPTYILFHCMSVVGLFVNVKNSNKIKLVVERLTAKSTLVVEEVCGSIGFEEEVKQEASSKEQKGQCNIEDKWQCCRG